MAFLAQNRAFLELQTFGRRSGEEASPLKLNRLTQSSAPQFLSNCLIIFLMLDGAISKCFPNYFLYVFRKINTGTSESILPNGFPPAQSTLNCTFDGDVIGF